MDVLILHEELASSDLPDRCIRCGERDTVLVPTVITTNIPILGGSFSYQTLDLPFCRDHEKPPLVSLTFPKARAFTAEGVIVANASPEFAKALEKRRKKREADPKRATFAVEPPPPPPPVSTKTWVLFGLGLFAAFVVLVGGISFIALTFVKK
ncbi:MAG TPA: hypothetical protein VHR72_05625 [Gemmataceae bacterium]|jgi:hypothetical protein|nr:hypothetical protein [Gemmataceae bacterium]